eukprot:scaffold11275_cov108-Isochrysis_galbana.AAC.8
MLYKRSRTESAATMETDSGKYTSNRTSAARLPTVARRLTTSCPRTCASVSTTTHGGPVENAWSTSGMSVASATEQVADAVSSMRLTDASRRTAEFGNVPAGANASSPAFPTASMRSPPNSLPPNPLSTSTTRPASFSTNEKDPGLMSCRATMRISDSCRPAFSATDARIVMVRRGTAPPLTSASSVAALVPTTLKESRVNVPFASSWAE